MNDQTRQLGQPRIRLERTTSTMDDVADRALNAAEGLTVVANEQTKGRGRAGRHWRAAPGSGLLFSTLLRPNCEPERFQVFPLLAGLAIADAIEASCGVSSSVKWPNDVLFDGRKVAGLLVTTRVVNGSVESAILGVGINVFGAPGDFDKRAVSLEEAAARRPDAEMLLDESLAVLSSVYMQVIAGDTRSLLERWLERAAFLGEEVDIFDGEVHLSGRFSGVTETGALVLHTESGGTREVHSGDMVRGPVHNDQERA